jgi:hypothetical protein
VSRSEPRKLSTRHAPAGRHRRRLAGAALLGLTLVAVGCGHHAGGDPGNRRLDELSADAAVRARPPGATEVHVLRTPARYVQPGITGGGWHGPGVVVSFTSAAPPAAVFRFYAQQAEQAGWLAGGSGGLGLTDTWRKSFPDGAAATLLLSPLTSQPGATQRRYRLSAGIAPATG